VTGVLAMMTLGCGIDPRRAPVMDGGNAIRDPLALGWAGCASIRKGPVCELGEQRLMTLWIEGGAWWSSKLMVASETGELVPKEVEEVEGGTRLSLEIPLGASVVEVREPQEGARWRLMIGPQRRPRREEEEIARWLAAGRAGRYAEALASLLALRASVSPESAGILSAAIGRMALGLGDAERAETAFRTSISAAEAEGRLSDVVRDGDALLWILVILRQRYGDARRLLDELTPFGAQYPEGAIWIENDAGMLAADTADIRTALEKYRSAERDARRLGRTTMEENASDDVARVLTRLGRADEAIAIQRMLPPPANPCARAIRTINLSEALMARASRRSTREPDADVAAALTAARAAAEACPDKERRLLALINATDYALDTRGSDSEEVVQMVNSLVAAPSDGDMLRASRRAEVLGRWQLAQGKPAAALATFEGQIPRVRALGLLDETFRSVVGSGRALAALGRHREALSRFEEAQRLLQQMLTGVPLGEGRSTFIGGRDRGVGYLVDALVQGGQVRRALRVARWIRSVELALTARLDRLATLPAQARQRWDEALERYRHIRRDIEREAGDDWQIPRSALAARLKGRKTRAALARAALDDAYGLLVLPHGGPPQVFDGPSKGEVHVVLFPGPDGWLVFAETDGAAIARRLSAFDVTSDVAAARTGAAALTLVDRALAGGRRVRMFPYGDAELIDWASVLWRGRPLLGAAEVEYGLDLGGHAKRIVEAREGRTALVIANPTGDLPGAAAEAGFVAAALTNWELTRLEGEAATRDATLAALPRARLLHYGGHARAAHQGDGALSSALILSRNERVELGDLLATQAVPELVVLSACEASATEPGAPSLLGLAQGFVAAGARAAIAPARAVDDANARQFVEAFYAALARHGWGARPERDSGATGLDKVRQAFRDAAARLAAGGRDAAGSVTSRSPDNAGSATWKSFRLLVP
jgi:tetratricopeptide (TPR) repeat protein